MLIRIRKIDVPVFVFLCAADKDKKLFRKFVFDFQFQDAYAHLQALVTKARHVIAGSRDSDNKLIRVRFCCLSDDVVLLCTFQRVQLIDDRNVAVQRVLCIGICGKCFDVHRSARHVLILDAVRHVVVKDSPSLILCLFLVAVYALRQVVGNVVVRLHCLFQRCRRDVNDRA